MRIGIVLSMVCLLASPLFGSEERGVISPELMTLMEEKGPGELIPVEIYLSEEIKPAVLEGLVAGKSKEERRRIVIEVLKRFSATSQRDVLQFLQVKERNGEVTDLHSLWIINGIIGKMTKGVIESVAKMKGIRGISREKILELVTNRRFSQVSDQGEDPRIATIEWNITRVDAPCAWALGYRGQGVIVGHLDSGANYNHADLRDHFWRNDTEFFGTFGVDDDNNGYVDDIRGYDFWNGDGDPIDDNGHGTHTAGTVAGDGTAGDSVGVAPDARIMALKVCGSGPSCSGSAILQAVQYALENGAQVMTISIGGPAGDPAYRNAFDNALAAGVLSSVAAGNSGPGSQTISSPGDVPPPWRHPDQVAPGGLGGVITVGGTTSGATDLIWSGSSRGPSTWETVSPWFDYPLSSGGLLDPDVVAPGACVTSLAHWSNAGYEPCWYGTSMATPHVAGLIALMLSKNPSLTPAQLDAVIETTAVDRGAAGKDNTYGSGRIDCCAAINAVPSLTTPWINRIAKQIDDSGGNNNGVWDAGETVNLIITLNNIGVSATNVLGDLSAGGDPLVTLVDSSATFGDMAQGDTTDNTSNPYVVTLDPSACPGYEVSFTLHITADGGYSRDVNFKITTGIRPSASANHDIWNGIYTITENGSLGFEGIPPATGQGFRYPGAGTNWLFYGSFAMGTSSTYVADRFYPGDEDLEVILCEALRFPQFIYSDQDGLVSFDDSGHSTPQGIKVTQDSWAWSDPTIDDFVIMRFTLLNEGASPVNGIYDGVFIDYDMPSSESQNNRGGTVSGDRLAYMYHATNPSYPYCGVCLLSPNTAANLSVIDHDLYVYPGMTEQNKIDFLNGTISVPSSDRAYDWSIVVSAGPFSLNPGDTAVSAFAIIGGSNLSNLQTSCQRADSIYDALSPYFLHDGMVTSLNAPGDTVFTDSTYPVSATVQNLGNVYETFEVSATIDGYTDTVTVVNLAPGNTAQVDFADWTVPSTDSMNYTMTVCTHVSQDSNTTNDCSVKSIFAYNPPVGIEEFTEALPRVYALYQNKPNPFQSNTNICFALPFKSEVDLRIFDITGRLVRTLANGEKEPGIFTVLWDGKDDGGARVGSGIYFYRLEAGEFRSTKKITLLR